MGCVLNLSCTYAYILLGILVGIFLLCATVFLLSQTRRFRDLLRDAMVECPPSEVLLLLSTAEPLGWAPSESNGQQTALHLEGTSASGPTSVSVPQPEVLIETERNNVERITTLDDNSRHLVVGVRAAEEGRITPFFGNGGSYPTRQVPKSVAPQREGGGDHAGDLNQSVPPPETSISPEVTESPPDRARDRVDLSNEDEEPAGVVVVAQESVKDILHQLHQLQLQEVPSFPSPQILHLIKSLETVLATAYPEDVEVAWRGRQDLRRGSSSFTKVRCRPASCSSPLFFPSPAAPVCDVRAAITLREDVGTQGAEGWRGGVGAQSVEEWRGGAVGVQGADASRRASSSSLPAEASSLDPGGRRYRRL